MSEEQNKTKYEECFCKSKYFKNFLTTALGVFVGGFFALSLHSAINEPKMPLYPMPPMPIYHTFDMPIIHHDCPCHKIQKPIHAFKQYKIDENRLKIMPKDVNKTLKETANKNK